MTIPQRTKNDKLSIHQRCFKTKFCTLLSDVRDPLFFLARSAVLPPKLSAAFTVNPIRTLTRECQRVCVLVCMSVYMCVRVCEIYRN